MTPHQDRTHGYREAWIAFRGGIAWMLLGWSIQVFHPRDPDFIVVMSALVPALKARAGRTS